MILIQKMKLTIIITILIVTGLNAIHIQAKDENKYSIPSLYECTSLISYNWEEFDNQTQTNLFCLLSMNGEQISALLSNPTRRSSEIFKRKITTLFYASSKSMDDFFLPNSLWLWTEINYSGPRPNYALLMYQWLIQDFLKAPIFRLDTDPETKAVCKDILDYISRGLHLGHFYNLNSTEQIDIIKMLRTTTTNPSAFASVNFTFYESIMKMEILFLWDYGSVKIPIMTINNLVKMQNIDLFKTLYAIDSKLRVTIFEEKGCNTLCRFQFLYLLNNSSFDITYKIPFANNSYTRFLNEHARLDRGSDSHMKLKVGDIEISNLSDCFIYASQSANNILQFTIYPPIGFFPHVVYKSPGLREILKNGPFSTLFSIFVEVTTRKFFIFKNFLEGTSHPPLYLARSPEVNAPVIFFHFNDTISIAICTVWGRYLFKNENPSNLEESESSEITLIMSSQDTPLFHRAMNTILWDQSGEIHLTSEDLETYHHNDTESWWVHLNFGSVDDRNLNPAFILVNGSLVYKGNGQNIQFPSPSETTMIVDHFLRHPAIYSKVKDLFESALIAERAKFGHYEDLILIPDLERDLKRCMLQESCRSLFFSKSPQIILTYSNASNWCHDRGLVTIGWNYHRIFRECIDEPNEFYRNLTKNIFDTNRGYSVIWDLFSETHLGISTEDMIFGLIQQSDIDFIDMHREEFYPSDIHTNILRLGSIANSSNLTDYDSKNGVVLFRMDHLIINCTLSNLINTMESSRQFNGAGQLEIRDFKAVVPIFFIMHLERVDLYARVNEYFLKTLILTHPIENDWLTFFNIMANKSIILGSKVHPHKRPPYRAAVKRHFKSLELAVPDEISTVIPPLSYETFMNQTIRGKADLICWSLAEEDLDVWKKMTMDDLSHFFLGYDGDNSFPGEVMENQLLNATSRLRLNCSTLVEDPIQKITMDNLTKLLYNSSLSQNISSSLKEFGYKLFMPLLDPKQ